MGTSKAINDLSTVPNIVGALGLSIAAAQKAFNLEYLNALERLTALAASLLSGNRQGDGGGGVVPLPDEQKASFEASVEMLKELLIKLAPPRYQFTETTLAVKLDLSQSLRVAGNAGIGIGLGAVAVNASLTLGYGYDYRAAAECRTVLHAVLPDPAALQALLARARELGDKPLDLPERTEMDKEIVAQSQRIFERLVGVKPPQITEKPA